MISIIINGTQKHMTQRCNIDDLLGELHVDRKEVAVERNCNVVQKNDFDTTYLQDGDHIEIVRFVGGG